MSWAAPHIEKLQQGEIATFRPRGHSMKGKVDDGQLVTVEPLGEEEPQHYLHLVKAKQGNPSRFQIGNNRGRINGWVGKNSVFGICTKIED